MTNVLSFVQAHPILTSLLALIAILAIVGLWYVLAHHLKQILNVLICVAGMISGAIVFWRGSLSDHVDLITIGTFLLLIFPIMFLQSVRRERKSLAATPTPIPGVVIKAGEAPSRRAS